MFSRVWSSSGMYVFDETMIYHIFDQKKLIYHIICNVVENDYTMLYIGK